MNFQEQKQQQIKQKCKELIQKYNENKKTYISYRRLNVLYPLKETYNTIIPLHLYTCWHTKDLPPLMQKNYDLLVQGNPKIKFHLYDENDCRSFIQHNFHQEVLKAYDSFIPCSYKSDLWRFCVLYINGGIYMDIKYRCVNGFHFIALTEKEYFVRDLNTHNVYTALIVTKPKNEIMLKCIQQIVKNSKNKYYGTDPLDPTGPGLLGTYFTQHTKNAMEMYHSRSYIENKLNQYYIVKQNRIILSFYEGYREEQSKYQKKTHYTQLWSDRKIYN